MPLDVLLGGGEALRTHRTDVLDELVGGRPRTTRRSCASTRPRAHRRGGTPPGGVAAADTGEARAGWVSWLLFSDGWRSLTPVRRDGRPVVVLSPVRPGDLGAQVAAQVALVRGAR